MNYAQLKKDLEGLYITIPTLFNDPDMSINEDGIRQHVSFLKSCDELPVFDFLLDLLHVADSSWVLAYCSVR